MDHNSIEEWKSQAQMCENIANEYKRKWEQAEADNAALRKDAERIQELVNQQAEDEGLWFIAETAPEAYLQQELRKLHAAMEKDNEKK